MGMGNNISSNPIVEPIVVELKSRDRIELHIESDGTEKIQAIACSSCLKLIKENLTTGKKVQDWFLPVGNAHSDILIRELILKAKGQWSFPILTEDLSTYELCHCRAVSAGRIDQAVIAGAHSMEQIRLATSATTGCGTCWSEVEKIIQYRLQKK
jgi:NAD(P)H-nitrite reductase large subunit